MKQITKKIKLATKDDLNNAVKGLATKDDLNDLKNAVKGLPTKEEFYIKMDEVMGELSTVRNEITILSDMKRQVNVHEERIEAIEEKLGVQPLMVA